MKSKLIKMAFVIAIAVLGGINVFNAQKSDVLSDTILANVEALAQTESIDMRRGYSLSIKSESCTVCEWTGRNNDYCDVHSQLPDCY